jgi:hypothetical protein
MPLLTTDFTDCTDFFFFFLLIRVIRAIRGSFLDALLFLNQSHNLPQIIH